MEDDKFEVRHQRLLASLDDLVAILGRCGEDRWADWIAKDRVSIAEGDGNALRHFLSAFGGMGSLNDVVLRSEDGRALDREERRALEERFADAKEAAWADARSILRDLDHA